MSEHLEKVLEHLGRGAGALVVQSSGVREFTTAFLSADPAGAAEVRPVIEWDREDGFVPPVEYLEELPEIRDVTEALDFVLAYPGRAIFVLDCRQIDWRDSESRLRRRLKQLGMKLVNQPPVIALLVVSQPIPPLLRERLECIGEAAETETEAGAAGSEPVSSGLVDAYRDLRDLQRFDTPEWEARLDALAPEAVQQLVACGAHREPLERIQELKATLKQRFARKDSLVDAVCAAALAQVPTVLIGPPGTAKSNLVRCYCEGLGLTARVSASPAGENGSDGRGYFEYLLTRYTTPEEIFGPIHVQDLIDRQTYRRVTDGYLPQAQVAFLDEIFKASSAILNTLLTLLNERIFYNAGRAEAIPLMMVFAASNEAPGDENLQALYDRFPLRLNCASVEDQAVGELLTASWQQAYDRQFSPAAISVSRLACTNDLRLLRHVLRVQFGGRTPVAAGVTRFDFEQEFLRFFRSLRADFGISDRTCALLLAFCRAQALLNNQTELTAAELEVFKLIAWDESGTGELERLVNNMKRGIRI